MISTLSLSLSREEMKKSLTWWSKETTLEQQRQPYWSLFSHFPLYERMLLINNKKGFCPRQFLFAIVSDRDRSLPFECLLFLRVRLKCRQRMIHGSSPLTVDKVSQLPCKEKIRGPCVIFRLILSWIQPITVEKMAKISWKTVTS